MTRDILGGRAARAIAVAVSLSLGGPAANAQDDAALFGGSDSKFWKVEHTDARARDGVLRVEEGPGWVRADRVLANFVLTLEVRLIRRDSKAAIYVRSWPTFDPRTSVPDNNYRMTLANGPSEKTGEASPPWRRVRIECIDGTIDVTLDDRLIETRTGVENPQGYVAFGALEGVVEFRAVEVKRLPSHDAQPPIGVFVPQGDVALPRFVSEVKPRYTAEAMRRRIQGAVLMSAVVQPDGTVGETTVLQSLDPKFGLDEEAQIAARQWRFNPGTREGQPVPVLVTIQLSFTLK